MDLLNRVLVNYVLITMVPVLLAAVLTQIIYNIRFHIKPTVLYTVSTTMTVGLIVTLLDILSSRLSSDFVVGAKTVLTFLAWIVLIKVIFKLSYIKCIISIGIYYIILGAGNIILFLFFWIIQIDFTLAKTNLALLIISHVIIDSVAILIIFLIRYFKLFSQLPAEIKSKAYRANIVYLVLTLMVIFANVIYYARLRNFFDIITLASSAVVILVFLVFNVINTNTFFKLETQSQELEYQKFYNGILEALMNDLRRVKHNYNNMLAVLGGYIKTKKWDQMEKYFIEINEHLSKISFLNNITSLSIKNAGLLGLLISKLEYSSEKGINIRIACTDEVNEINMKVSELYEVLGILLDNAIEASAKSDAKHVEIFIKNTDEYFSFIIENSYAGNVEVNKIFNEGYSTKGDGRGLGLSILKNIVAKYNSVTLNTIANEKIFKQELLVSNDIKKAV